MSGETMRGGGLDAFEVFLQTAGSTQLAYVGSLLAAGDVQAWRLAREIYARRDDAVRLWVVRRDRVYSAEADGRRLLGAKSRMPYRLPAYPQQRRRRRSGLPAPERRQRVQLGPAPSQLLAASDVPGVPDPVGSLWAAMADDLFLHAHRLCELTVDYTELEDALAVGSIAQEDLAHARTILGLLGCDEAKADSRFFDRPARLWQPTPLTASAREDRAWSVARGLVLAAGAAALLLSTVDALGRVPDPTADSTADSAAGAVRSALGVMASEQRLHLAHWTSRAALYDHPAHRHELAGVLMAATSAAEDLFGATRPAGLPGLAPAYGADLPAVSPAVLTSRFRLVLNDAGLVPGFIPRLPDPPRPRVPGHLLPEGERAGLAAVLAELRDVRAGYPRGAFL